MARSPKTLLQHPSPDDLAAAEARVEAARIPLARLLLSDGVTPEAFDAARAAFSAAVEHRAEIARAVLSGSPAR